MKMLDMDAVRQNLNKERALFVKQQMDGDDPASWRELTYICWEAWGKPDWIEPGNQFWGKALMDVAGEILGCHIY